MNRDVMEPGPPPRPSGDRVSVACAGTRAPAEPAEPGAHARSRPCRASAPLPPQAAEEPALLSAIPAAPGILSLLLLFALLLPAQAGTSTPAAEPRSPRVLTSFLPVFSITRGIAGDRAHVENWLPPGIDPHEFQFQPRDLRRLRQADLLVIAGLGLEGWREPQLRSAADHPALRVIEAAEGLPQEARIIGPSASHGHEEKSAEHSAQSPATDTAHTGGINPHFWQDPMLMTHAVTNILNALIAIDPASREIYQGNARATVAELAALDHEFRTALEPVRNTAFITYHPAFPYLARRYGLKLVGVVEETAAEEPSPRELAELAATVRREKARVLFIDGQPTRLARRLASDLGLVTARLETLETGVLSTDAYVAGMRRNLATLQRSLSPVPVR